jgi:putative endonuclease
MSYLYILQSERNGRYYIGSTSDIARRLVEHNAGKTKSLKYLLPVKLVFSQQYQTPAEAQEMEKRLKKLKSRRIVDRIVREGKIKLGP